MVLKILTTIGLMIIVIPIIGSLYGIIIGRKAESFVYPTVLIAWGAVIYFVWFTSLIITFKYVFILNMKEYHFNNDSNFEVQLKQIDKTVLFLSKGRKTEHTERYSIVNFLKTFIDSNIFSLPFTLIHRDRPDFLISNINANIGIEFTESVPEQLVRAHSLLQSNLPDGILEPSIFGWNAPPRNNSEILEILLKSQVRLIGQGSTGYSIEELWVKGILGCFSNKIRKLNSNEFKKYTNNWLLIYDNQQRTLLDFDYVSEKLERDLNKLLLNVTKYNFDNIFIELPNNYFRIKLKQFAEVSIISNKIA